MKGIVMAGGAGSRLWPLTNLFSKHLLPVYDKPMIYYPIATLMLAGIRQMLILSTPDHVPHYQALLGDGQQWGLQFDYQVQDKPKGIAEGLLLAEDYIDNNHFALVLGDNIFYGHQMGQLLKQSIKEPWQGAHIFSYWVKDPTRYGVVQFDDQNCPVDILEKPKNPPSHYAVTGLYFYDPMAIDIAKGLTPSARGELEITDVNRAYLREQKLTVHAMGRGNAWLDTGTPEALLDAGEFFHTIEERQGLKINAPEEIAWRMGWIDNSQLAVLAQQASSSSYGQYLLHLLQEQT